MGLVLHYKPNHLHHALNNSDQVLGLSEKEIIYICDVYLPFIIAGLIVSALLCGLSLSVKTWLA